MTTIALACRRSGVGDRAAEVLDDHLGLLREVVRVQRHEPGDRRAAFARVDLGVVGDRLLAASRSL